ncbi:MAG: nitroreductase [Alphaproteobacteria bacterium]|nr:nitroreductase [Alphaproteobacteria bacterium]
MDAFNDLSTPLSLIATRRSGKARDMVAPGPDAEGVRELVALASRVPDHGKLAPWRFVHILAEARDAFADLLEAAYRAEKPDAGRLEAQAMRAFATQAPALIVVLSRPVQPSHIPLWEQELSAGAVTQNLMLAAHAKGYVANWLTGWPAFSPAVHAALAEPGERIAGFVFIGSPAKPLDERPRPLVDDLLRTWNG